MLAYKSWSPESLLWLLFKLGVALFVVMLAGMAADAYWSEIEEETRRFWVGTACGIGVQVLGLVLFGFFVRENGLSWREAFGLRREESWRMIGWGLLTATGAMIFVLGLLLLSGWIMTAVRVEVERQASIQALIETRDRARQLAIGVTAIALAPVFEEILFRGILYPALKQAGYPRLAVWGTALLFGVSHMNVLVFLSLTFFGVVLAWLYERTNHLLAPIAAHVAFNTANYFWALRSGSLT
jgi:membrane protease YdiL (CAAX protease family)